MPSRRVLPALAPTVASLLLLLAAPGARAQLAPANDAGIRFGHVHLNVADIGMHTALWTEHFGGEVVQKGPLTTIKMPGMFLIFTEREPTGRSQGSVVDHFGFKVPDLQAALRRWRDAGLEVQAEFTGGEGTDNAYLLAPDGVRVELQEDPSLDVPAQAYHVHLYAPEVSGLMDWYIETFSGVQRARGTHETTADVPGINLTFNESSDGREPTRGRALDHIGFEVDDLEAFCDALAAAGIEFQLAYREIASIELAIAFFTDPSGVYIELTEGLDEY